MADAVDDFDTNLDHRAWEYRASANPKVSPAALIDNDDPQAALIASAIGEIGGESLLQAVTYLEMAAEERAQHEINEKRKMHKGGISPAFVETFTQKIHSVVERLQNKLGQDLGEPVAQKASLYNSVREKIKDEYRKFEGAVNQKVLGLQKQQKAAEEKAVHGDQGFAEQLTQGADEAIGAIKGLVGNGSFAEQFVSQQTMQGAHKWMINESSESDKRALKLMGLTGGSGDNFVDVVYVVHGEDCSANSVGFSTRQPLLTEIGVLKSFIMGFDICDFCKKVRAYPAMMSKGGVTDMKFYCSPLPRAMQTAKMLSVGYALELEERKQNDIAMHMNAAIAAAAQRPAPMSYTAYMKKHNTHFLNPQTPEGYRFLTQMHEDVARIALQEQSGIAHAVESAAAVGAAMSSAYNYLKIHGPNKSQAKFAAWGATSAYQLGAFSTAASTAVAIPGAAAVGGSVWSILTMLGGVAVGPGAAVAASGLAIANSETVVNSLLSAAKFGTDSGAWVLSKMTAAFAGTGEAGDNATKPKQMSAVEQKLRMNMAEFAKAKLTENINEDKILSDRIFRLCPLGEMQTGVGSVFSALAGGNTVDTTLRSASDLHARFVNRVFPAGLSIAEEKVSNTTAGSRIDEQTGRTMDQRGEDTLNDDCCTKKSDHCGVANANKLYDDFYANFIFGDWFREASQCDKTSSNPIRVVATHESFIRDHILSNTSLVHPEMAQYVDDKVIGRGARQRMQPCNAVWVRYMPSNGAPSTVMATWAAKKNEHGPGLLLPSVCCVQDEGCSHRTEMSSAEATRCQIYRRLLYQASPLLSHLPQFGACAYRFENHNDDDRPDRNCSQCTVREVANGNCCFMGRIPARSTAVLTERLGNVMGELNKKNLGNFKDELDVANDEAEYDDGDDYGDDNDAPYLDPTLD